MSYLAAAIGSLLGCSGPLSAWAMPCTTTALVLAIDSSGSIDDAEFAFQMQATAWALTDPEVVAAMRAVGGVAVAAVIWGDAAWRAQIIDWQLVSSTRQAAAFGASLLTQAGRVSGNTDIGRGIDVALDLLDRPDTCASRQIIDVSGDGRETLLARSRSLSLLAARERAQGLGVTINGLAVTIEDPGLSEYYASRLILGEGSFVITVADWDTFAEALKRKLLRELAPQPALATLHVEDTPTNRLLTNTTAFGMPRGHLRSGRDLPPEIGASDASIP